MKEIEIGDSGVRLESFNRATERFARERENNMLELSGGT